MLEQKLNSEQKDERQLPSSPNNGNTHVVVSVVEIEIPLMFCPKCNSTDIQQHTKGEDICKSCGHVWDIYRPHVGLS